MTHDAATGIKGSELEFGLDTFGDVTYGPDGERLPHAQVLRNVVAEGVRADAVGLDFFGVGEHHRDDFSVSAPEVVLANLAAKTERIHLGSVVTVLSSDDPIRVYERFSTLNALSEGRAEVVLGRGSFTESFPLFGFQLEDYEVLFDEKLEIFTQLLQEKPVKWSGATRPPLEVDRVYPPIESGRLKAWIGVGGTPESVVRAARYGLPLTIAVIGGSPARFRPLVDLYFRSLQTYGHERLPVGLHSPGYIAETDEQAREELWPHYEAMHNRIGRQRGWPPLTREEFEHSAGATGAFFVGSPSTVAEKIAHVSHALSISRFDLKYSIGTLPHESLMNCIHLFGTEVVPLVRERLHSAAK